MITQEDLERLRARDERWKQVDLSLRIDAELRDSVALNLFIEAAARRAEEAKALLVQVNPADTKAIIALQAKAQCATLIGEVLYAVRQQGEIAYASLQEDGQVNLEKD